MFKCYNLKYSYNIITYYYFKYLILNKLILFKFIIISTPYLYNLRRDL